MNPIARQNRIAAIKDWQRAQLAEFETDSPAGLSTIARAAWNEHADELARLTDEQYSVIASSARSGEAGVYFGYAPVVNAVRDQGLRTVDDVHARTGMPDAQAERLQTMLRTSDPANWAARYMVAVADEAYNSAFGKVVQDPNHGHLRFTPREIDAWQRVNAIEGERALVAGTGSSGGFAIPIDLDPSIISTGSGSLNPIRDIARVITTSGFTWKGVSADAPTAEYAGEAAQVADASPTFVQPSIQTQRGDVFVPFSFELGQDWPSIQAELTSLMGESRLNLDSGKFFNGSGTNEPVGVLGGVAGAGGSLTVTQRIQTATTVVYALADVYSLKAAIGNTKFQASATWAIHPSVLDTTFRFVGSGSTTEPQIFSGGRGGDLLGKHLVEWTALASTTGTIGNKIAVYGDWQSYTIVDRIGSTVELVPHLFGAAGRPTLQKGFVMYWRMGAGVTRPNGLRYLEIK